MSGKEIKIGKTPIDNILAVILQKKLHSDDRRCPTINFLFGLVIMNFATSLGKWWKENF